MQYKENAMSKLPNCNLHNLVVYYIKQQFIYSKNNLHPSREQNLSYKQTSSQLMACYISLSLYLQALNLDMLSTSRGTDAKGTIVARLTNKFGSWSVLGK
jgi:hypothetical protein